MCRCDKYYSKGITIANRISGTTGDDVLKGGNGNDILLGLAGQDLRNWLRYPLHVRARQCRALTKMVY